MCNDPKAPTIAICACGAYFKNCDYLNAMLHITCDSGPSHKWVYLISNSFVAGRDHKTFDKQILIWGKPMRRGG
jgi:hypothetical protein